MRMTASRSVAEVRIVEASFQPCPGGIADQHYLVAGRQANFLRDSSLIVILPHIADPHRNYDLVNVPP